MNPGPIATGKISEAICPNQGVPGNVSYSTLLYYSILFSYLLFSSLLYSTLLYSTLLYSTLYRFPLLYSTLEVYAGLVCLTCKRAKLPNAIALLDSAALMLPRPKA